MTMSSVSSAGSPDSSARHPQINMPLEEEPEFMIELLDSFGEYSSAGHPDDDLT